MARRTTKPTGPRRVVGYVRISKDRDDETSTTTQKAAIHSHCDAHGKVVVEVIVEPGRSAFKESRGRRPGLRRALDMIEAGAADELVVWKIDRCSRNARDLLNLVHDLEGKGVAFASVTESFDTSTAMGRTMLTVVGALAELESATKSERATAWQDHRRSIHATPSATPPRGYRRPTLDGKPVKNVLELDPTEAPLMREAFRRLTEGASLRSQVRWLGDHGLTITQRGLTVTLSSPTIAGLVDIGDGELVAGDWPALVDREAWAELRAILADPTRTTNRSGGERRFALAGIARCHCDEVMISKSHVQGPRLMCRACSTGIRYAEVEELVAADVLDKLDDATWKSLRAQGRGRHVAAEEIHGKIADLMAMMAANELTVDEFRTLKLGLEGQLAASTAPALNLPDVESVRSSWKSLTVDQRRLVFLAVVESLVIAKANGWTRSVDVDRIELDLID